MNRLTEEIMKMKSRREELEDLMCCATCDISNIASELPPEKKRILLDAISRRLEIEKALLKT